jgi:hypothetical protein
VKVFNQSLVVTSLADALLRYASQGKEPYRPTIAEGVPIAGPDKKKCSKQLLGYQPSIFPGANLAYSD